jgi:putative PIN family toxin of toxin-antitoxin system
VIVVLDSGIWISAFQFGGIPQTALDSAFSDHEIAICDQIMTEVRATLVRKFSWKDEEVLELLKEYVGDGTLVEVTGDIQGICRDPKDDMVFECAIKSDAGVIVSGDKDLLSVDTYEGIKVFTARQFVDVFSARRT